MHKISLAPVLSATRSRDSCWITSTPSRASRSCAGPPGSSSALTAGSRSLCLLENLDQPPALGRRQRAGFHQQHPVSDSRGVRLVMRFYLGGGSHHLAVQGVLLTVLKRHHNGLVHLVRDDVTLADLSLGSPFGLRHLILPFGLGHLALPFGLGLLLAGLAHAAPSLPAMASGDTDRPSSRSR